MSALLHVGGGLTRMSIPMCKILGRNLPWWSSVVKNLVKNLSCNAGYMERSDPCLAQEDPTG